MKKDDYVISNRYPSDMIFKITDIKDDIYYLKGLEYRLNIEASINDLELVLYNDEAFNRYQERVKEVVVKQENYLCGKILHLDGDKEYLDRCLKLYKNLGIYAKGFNIPEKDMKDSIISLVEEHNPDIIVITGHDIFNNKDSKNIHNYENSLNFYNTVKEIRKRYSLDQKIVIAGACQSNFELLISAGANFASSPKRVNIHVFDPAIIAVKASVTSYERTINMENILKHSFIKRDGIGGIETKGKMRLFMWYN